MPEQEYHVMWEIDSIGAESPEAAAKQAWETIRRKDSTACVFTVTEPLSGEQTRIDLLDHEDDN